MGPTNPEALMSSFTTRLHDRLGLRTSPRIFFGSAALIVVFTASMALFPDPVRSVFGSAAHWLRFDLGWFYTAAATLLLADWFDFRISAMAGF